MNNTESKLIEEEALHIGGVMLINGWKIYTPKDNESVIVIEDPFGHQREMDIDDFVKMLEVLHSVKDY